MVKRKNQKETPLHKNLREFVNNIIEKNYAAANANLTLAVNEKIKAQMATILEENP